MAGGKGRARLRALKLDPLVRRGRVKHPRSASIFVREQGGCDTTWWPPPRARKSGAFQM
eukprot:CAMPEP_0175196278 /NCGR_PEP_ID=MMETSP0093-20121207/7429_1 /TAXON_ID=311494 /ORGANISM="Alexandrium monilatum, Strain CCMP3105" /LENGTH=58 /DNA_ID=CAMNT_0016489235 /DNA_START=33 /DNA_END=209 /DNA_ORIENTATION=-